MNRSIKYVIALILLAGIVLLARNGVVNASVSQNQELLKNDVKLDNAAQAANPGTVKPPSGEVVITESGSYSIGGFCNFSVEFIATDISVHVYLERPLPRPLPDKVHAVRQGCRVTYYPRPGGCGSMNLHRQWEHQAYVLRHSRNRQIKYIFTTSIHLNRNGGQPLKLRSKKKLPVATPENLVFMRGLLRNLENI